MRRRRSPNGDHDLAWEKQVLPPAAARCCTCLGAKCFGGVVIQHDNFQLLGRTLTGSLDFPQRPVSAVVAFRRWPHLPTSEESVQAAFHLLILACRHRVSDRHPVVSLLREDGFEIRALLPAAKNSLTSILASARERFCALDVLGVRPSSRWPSRRPMAGSTPKLSLSSCRACCCFPQAASTPRA